MSLIVGTNLMTRFRMKSWILIVGLIVTSGVSATPTSSSTSLNTPIACAVKLDGGGTCGTNDWDHLNANQTIANGHQYAGCDRDVCNEVCTEDVTRQEFLQKTSGGNEYYCFNTSSILQKTMEGSEIYKYAINCKVETTSGTAYGKFHPGANITDCNNNVLLNTESLCVREMLTSVTPPPSSDHDHDHDHDHSHTNPPPPSLSSGTDYGAPGVTFAALMAILVFLLC